MHATLGLLQAVGIGVAAILVVIVVLFVASVILSAIKVVKEYERGVIFRLGRVQEDPRVQDSSSSFPWSTGWSR